MELIANVKCPDKQHFATKRNAPQIVDISNFFLDVNVSYDQMGYPFDEVSTCLGLSTIFVFPF